MSPEQFLQSANLLPEAMLLVSGEGTILAGNRAAGKRLMIPPRELPGRWLSEFLADSPSSISEYLHACSGTRDLVPYSLCLYRPDGGHVPCRAEGAVIRPRSGNTPSLLLLRLIPKSESPTQFAILTERIHELNREIGRRRKVEQELRDQQEWLQVTLSSIGDGVIATDSQGCVLFLNPRAEMLTGWSQGEAMGKPLQDVFRIINHHTRQSVENPAAQVLREGRVVGLANDTVLVSKQGKEWPIADSGAPIQDEKGNVLGVVMVFLEVSERKEMERVLRQQAEELREANRRKDEYIAMLAHELRNPLGALSNAMVLIERTEPGAPAFHRALDVARRQLRNQTRMVEDLLDVSRINRGTFQLRTETLDLARLCSQAADECRPSLEGRAIRFLVFLPESPVWIKGDSARLSQVLANLLTNAEKFTPAGGEVKLQLEILPQLGQAHLSVSDTGVGIDPTLLPHIFEAFIQGEQNLARSRGGLGLGLALVKGLVELHGGEVHAQSPGVDLGSTFSVLLPVTGTSLPGSAHLLSGSVMQSPIHVLLIEDMKDAAETLRDILELWGCRVDIAFSGSQGVEAALKLRPDVIICDLGLPEMDGYSVAHSLKGDSRTATAWLIALTGYGGEEDRKRSAEAGFDNHLAKPVDIDQLQQLLGSFAQQLGRAEIAE